MIVLLCYIAPFLYMLCNCFHPLYTYDDDIQIWHHSIARRAGISSVQIVVKQTNWFVLLCIPTGTEVIRTCDPLALNDCKVANKVTYCYCNGDLCNSRPVSSFGIDDQSNYDASESGDDDDADDYGDEFSGMRPTTTVSLPGGIKTDSRGNSGRGRSTPGGGWTTGQQGMNANSHTPFHYAATLGPPTATKPWSSSSSSSSGSCRFCMSDTKGLVRPLAQLLIVLVLSLGRNRWMSSAESNHRFLPSGINEFNCKTYVKKLKPYDVDQEERDSSLEREDRRPG